MNDITYTIVKNESFDEFGELEYTWYNIKHKKTKWFGYYTYWKYITKPGYYSDTSITFSTEEKAQKFIKDVLCKDNPYNKTTHTPISEVKCEVTN